MRVQHWAVGLFIVAGLGLLTAFLFLIGDRQKAFGKHIELRTEFANLSGLASGAKVRVSGLDAGKIKKIEIPNRASVKFKLELEVDEKARGMIRKDSIASIETEGVVGDKYVLIKRGSDRAGEVQAGAMLPSKEPLDLGALMERGSGLLNDVQGTMTDVRGRVDVALDSITKTVNHTDVLITGVKPDIYKIANNGSKITGKIDTLVTDIGAGKGPAGLLLRDEATKQQLQATLSKVKDISENVDQASVRANQTLADFQSRDLAAKTQKTLENVQAMSQELNTTMHGALGQDNMGQDAAANLNQTLSNLNRTTTNLAEDTEALKHNFLFRGFFKKRGFYNLDQLTTSEYERACARQKDAGTRKWLQASNLVVSDAMGEEQLTEAGRRHIDTEIAPVVNVLADNLIVVEGYSAEGSPERQFVIARRRADLVRRYLERRYHIRHSNLGIIPLRSKPPENAGRDSWDGAAIMLLNTKAKK